MLLSILGLLLAACARLPTLSERQALAEGLALQQGWQSVVFSVAPFDLVAYLPARSPRDDHLTIYIEGDGFAWTSSSQPSRDPTPRNPVALKMALAHSQGNAAYLARPCQYSGARAGYCPQRYWTAQRFAPEVIAAAGQALDALKLRFNARQLTLVGYSGGGAVAALVAAKRTDVVRLITVAGNLDHHAWAQHHGIAPLTGSLNPADECVGLAPIPQVHFAGSEDRVMPPDIVQAFATGFPPSAQVQVRVVTGYGHLCCWAENWAELWAGMRLQVP